LPSLAERPIRALLQSRLDARFSLADIRFNPVSLPWRIKGLELIDANGWNVLSLGGCWSICSQAAGVERPSA